MKKLFYLLALFTLSSVCWAQITPIVQSNTVTTVAPPAAGPLGTSQLTCTGTSGTFAANTYLIAYTYTGTTASSESKASADSLATTVVTCPTNGTLTIPSPPAAPGCFNCVGWRPYVVASSSGTGAELLQTITAQNCVLAATSGLTACAINQPFTETALGAGAAEPTNPLLFTPVVGAFLPLSEAGLQIGTHTLYWTTTGTAATCTVQLETSTTQGGSFTLATGTVAQTCTSSGVYQVSNLSANFVRVNLTAFTATGANVPSIVFTLIDPPMTPIAQNIVFCPLKVCVPTQEGLPPLKIVSGFCLAAAATTCVVSAMPAFTSTTSYACSVTDQTTAANNALTVTNTSATSITITTSSSSDTFAYICVGT